MIKKITILLIFAIISCSNNKDISNNTIKVALINGVNTTFVETLIRDIKDYAQKNYTNISIIEKNASIDTVQQQSQIESLITQEIDGVILQVVNPGIASSIDSYAKENETPILYFNVKPNTLVEGSYSYVGMDEKTVAFLQVQEVLKVRDYGNAVILSGNINNEATSLRTEGIYHITNTKITILEQESADWYEDKAESIMERWISLGIDMDIVFANNDDMAIGAIRSLENAGKKLGTNDGEVMVLGVDGTDNGLEYIRNGKMYATIKQDTKLEAKMIIDTIVDMIVNNSNNKRTILVSPEVINSENITNK